MASIKIIDDANRLKYVRALERFHKSMIGYLLNSSNGKKEEYDRKVDSNLKIFYRVQEVALYKGDLQDLHKLIKKIIELKNSDKNFQDIKEQILYASNQLEKTKNARRYKKDKHSQSKYQDWE